MQLANAIINTHIRSVHLTQERVYATTPTFAFETPATLAKRITHRFRVRLSERIESSAHFAFIHRSRTFITHAENETRARPRRVPVRRSVVRAKHFTQIRLIPARRRRLQRRITHARIDGI